VDVETAGIASVAVRLAEGASLQEVLDPADPAAWIALEAAVRQTTWRPGADPLTEAQLALALCHRDGRIRAAALKQASAHPGLWPLVVVRCSDWAQPVREDARRLLAEGLDPESAVRLMPLILRIGRRSRGDFVTDLATGVLRAAPRGTLAPLYTDDDRVTRRYAYRLAVAQGFLSPAELARGAARDDDTVVQCLCADAALAALGEGDADDDVLEPLLAARNPQARSAGVTALRRAGRGERAVGFLGDRAGMVRACARYVVRQSGSDPVEWYRRRCADDDDLGLSPGVVSGLAECGDRKDAEVLWALTGHPDPVVRARAVGGLRLLDVLDVRRLRALLDDPAPGVVREATLALVPSVRMLDDGWLLERLAVGRARETRVSAFRLLTAHGGLVRLRAAVALLDDPDDRLRLWARQSARRWRPTADVPPGSAEVGELLDRARLFDKHALHRLRWEAGLKV
jgi:HEAT repeat protein